MIEPRVDSEDNHSNDLGEIVAWFSKDEAEGPSEVDEW
jgi:hypothetical protein